jgi:hypothetical protein
MIDNSAEKGGKGGYFGVKRVREAIEARSGIGLGGLSGRNNFGVSKGSG